MLVAEVLLVFALLVLSGWRALPADDSGPVPPAEELVHRIDLNRAPWHELVHLPGIGATRAMEIVRDRDANGPFGSPDELTRVKGIGPSTVEAVRDHFRRR